MGLASGVTTTGSISPSSGYVFLGTSLDYAWTYGTIGPIPTEYASQARTYVPYSVTTPANPVPVDRSKTVYGLVGRMVLDVTSPDFP